MIFTYYRTWGRPELIRVWFGFISLTHHFNGVFRSARQNLTNLCHHGFIQLCLAVVLLLAPVAETGFSLAETGFSHRLTANKIVGLFFGLSACPAGDSLHPQQCCNKWLSQAHHFKISFSDMDFEKQKVNYTT